MDITYRNFVTEDIDNIISFWNENSGWESDMDRNEFDLRFCSSPFGAPIIMLAIDDDTNDIIGLCCFLALRVTINGSSTACYRPFGAVLKEQLRKNFGVTSLLMGTHPILVLYNSGSKIAQQNASLIYLIPDPRWSKVLRILPFDTHQFPLWSYVLKQDDKPLNNTKIEVKDLSSDDANIDELWKLSPKSSLCTLTKTTLFYEYKISVSHEIYQLKGVYQENQLIGLFTLQFKSAGRQWLIGDLLTLDNNERLILTLQAACYAARLEYLNLTDVQSKVYKVAILATPLIEQHVKSLGFYKDNYNFTLAVQLLDKNTFNKDDVAPKRWYINAND